MSKNVSLLGIMVTDRKGRKSVLANYQRYNKTNMKIFCFTPSDINWKQKRIVGLHCSNRKWVVRLFPFPQVIYNRCYELKQEMIERLEAVIGSNKCFNHINHFNKYETHTQLRKWLVPYLPETVPYENKNAAELLSIHKLLYFKPSFGSMGRGVYRVEMKDSGEIHIGDHYILPKIIVGDALQFQDVIHTLLGSTPYIIQRGVDIQRLSDRIFDIRVLTQKNKTGIWSITNVISRVAFRGCFNTSIFEKMCLTKETLHYLHPPDKANAILNLIYDISLRAAKIIEIESKMHLGELSVDFALDSDSHPWIIEVNGKPQKKLYNAFRSNKYNAYKRPLEYASFLQNH